MFYSNKGSTHIHAITTLCYYSVHYLTFDYTVILNSGSLSVSWSDLACLALLSLSNSLSSKVSVLLPTCDK